ncbi:MAG: sugar phosphate nucleotidyltransferase [Hyphomicrobium sp.]
MIGDRMKHKEAVCTAASTATLENENGWALILAGGDGTRLQALTRIITGVPIPKQYCRIIGEKSLIEATLARVSCVVPRERTLVILNENHLDVARTQLATLPRQNVVVQPCNRDTGPGLVMALLFLARRAPEATLAVFPSDHFIRSQAAFAASVERMQRVLAVYPEKIVLLGVRPDRVDPSLGYVIPAGTPSDLERLGGFRVQGFEEKPAPSRAAAIIRQGALWSSFIMLFRVRRMLEIVRAVRPREVAAMERFLGDPAAGGLDYRRLGAWNLSHDVLAQRPHDLLVIAADDLGWSDWGTPDAIVRTVSALGLTTPPWLSAPLTEARGSALRESKHTDARASQMT